MKKIISILISLLLLASAFGVGTVMAIGVQGYAEPETVRVGQIITVVSNYDPCVYYDSPCVEYTHPLVYIYDPKIYNQISYADKSAIDVEFQEAIGYVTMLSDPIKKPGCPETWTWTYRANRPGKVVFLVKGQTITSFYPVPVKTNTTYKDIPVTILPRSLPMQQFMKLLGFGGLMRE